MLRRTVFSVLAACVALAAGIALGSGPLQGHSDRASLASDNRSLQRRLADAQRAAGYDQTLLAASTAGTIKGRLKGLVVGVFALPNISPATVTRTTADLQLAGAQVTTLVTMRPALVDAQQKVYVGSVATNTFRGVHDLVPVSSADSYERIGALIARAYVAKTADSSSFDKESIDIDAQLQGANLVKTSDDPARRGNVVLVLDSGGHGASKSIKATRIIERSLLGALLEGSDGLVVASHGGADLSGGLLQAIAADDALSDASTVNVLGSAAGRVTTVLAIAAVGAAHTGGRYGIVQGRPVLPPGLS
jgi:hypothetical protein